MRALSPRWYIPLVIMIVMNCVSARAQDVVIIVNKDVSVLQITSAELRDIFTGTRSRFSDRTRAVPVALKGGAVHEVFLRNYLHQNPEEFRTVWRKAVFTGEGAMLKEFGSEAALLEYVSTTPGAIGYASRVPDGSSLKVVVVSR